MITDFFVKNDLVIPSDYISIDDEESVLRAISRWDSMCFLDGISDELLRRYLAVSYENCMIGSIKNDDVRNGFSVVLFPMVRRMVSRLKTPRVLTYDDMLDLTKRFTFRDVLSFVINSNFYMFNCDDDVDSLCNDINTGFNLHTCLSRLNTFLYRVNLVSDKLYCSDKVTLSTSQPFHMLLLDDFIMNKSCYDFYQMIDGGSDLSFTISKDAFRKMLFDRSDICFCSARCSESSLEESDNSLMRNIVFRVLGDCGNNDIDFEAEYVAMMCDLFIMYLNGEYPDCGEFPIKYDEHLYENLVRKVNN